jgi:predicted ATP-dependent endonuclease of OLD family
LGPLNVLIGPNGSGKSSFLQAIDFSRTFFRSSVEVYLQERGWNSRDLADLRETAKNLLSNEVRVNAVFQLLEGDNGGNPIQVEQAGDGQKSQYAVTHLLAVENCRPGVLPALGNSLPRASSKGCESIRELGLILSSA